MLTCSSVARADNHNCSDSSAAFACLVVAVTLRLQQGMSKLHKSVTSCFLASTTQLTVCTIQASGVMLLTACKIAGCVEVSRVVIDYVVSLQALSGDRQTSRF